MAHPLTAILTQIGVQLGQGDIRQRPNDGEVEWRGLLYGLPTRLKVYGRDSIEGLIKFNNPHGIVNLNWDPEYVNDPGDADAFDEDDIIRVFVGPGVCIETFAWDMASQMAGFRTLPYEQMRHLIGAIARDRAARVYIRGDELAFGFNEELGGWPDAAAAVRFTQMAGWCCAHWQSAAPDPTAMKAYQAISKSMSLAGVQGAPVKMKCTFCQCAFLLGADGHCPNCGAPAQG